ncbi:MAG: HAD family hydrolase [Lysobacteraceae bacterium]
MLISGDTVFLLDVDNTLLDNDRFSADLRARLTQDFGAPENERYWTIYDALRNQRGYADYLDALQEFRAGHDGDPKMSLLSAFLLEYPFADRFYPHTMKAIAHLRSLGLPVVLSDGDIVFQPRKIQRSGIWDAVDGRVMICVHKQRSLVQMQQRFPAAHYVMVDDKPQLLAEMKQLMGETLTTVFVRQGHYAAESVNIRIEPAPDHTIERIGDLCNFDLQDFQPVASASA